MADVPAANITGQLHNNTGQTKMWHAKVKGDGSGTTMKVPFASVVAIAIGNIDETAVVKASFSGGTVTYGAAPTNNLSHYITIFGW